MIENQWILTLLVICFVIYTWPDGSLTRDLKLCIISTIEKSYNFTRKKPHETQPKAEISEDISNGRMDKGVDIIAETDLVNI